MVVPTRASQSSRERCKNLVNLKCCWKQQNSLLHILIFFLSSLDYIGVAVDSPNGKDIAIIKTQGKVKALEDEIFQSQCNSQDSFIVLIPMIKQMSLITHYYYYYFFIFSTESRMGSDHRESRRNCPHAMGNSWCPIGSQRSSPEIWRRSRFPGCSQWWVGTQWKLYLFKRIVE